MHAPLKSKRVKNLIKCPWLTDDIITKMRLRDSIDKHVKPDEYRIIRNVDIKKGNKVTLAY